MLSQISRLAIVGKQGYKGYDTKLIFPQTIIQYQILSEDHRIQGIGKSNIFSNLELKSWSCKTFSAFYQISQLARDSRSMRAGVRKGPCINDLHNIIRILDPLSPFVTLILTQPISTIIYSWVTLLLSSARMSYVNMC